MDLYLKKITKSNLITAIKSSLLNDKHMSEIHQKTKGKSFKIKYFIWCILFFFLSPKKEIKSKKFVAMITPVGEERLKSYSEYEEYYKFAKLNDSILKIIHNRSVISPYSLKERCTIFWGGIYFYNKNKSIFRGCLPFVLEYYAIAYFIAHMPIEEIIFQGLYDRYSTLISYLGFFKGIRIIGVQDGACVIDNVPAKIYCNKMYCFDEFEEQKLKNYIFNKDCVYKYIGFQSLIHWSEYDSSNKKIIAVASQDWFTSKTIEFISILMKNQEIKNYTVIIYPHYREEINQYKRIKDKYPELIISPKVRYKNLDLLVTFFSTIVYDFWSVNKELNVVCIHIPGFESAYYQRNNVYISENCEKAVEQVIALLK